MTKRTDKPSHVKSSDDISSEAKKRVHSSTGRFYGSTGRVSSGTPHKSHRQTVQTSLQSCDNSQAFYPKPSIRLKYDGTSGNTIRSETERRIKTGNLTTGSIQHADQMNRIHIYSQNYKSVTDRVRTSSNSAAINHSPYVIQRAADRSLIILTSSYGRSDDLGSSAAAGTAAAGAAAARKLHMAQDISPQVVHGLEKGAAAAGDAARTGYRAVLTLSRSASEARGYGAAPISKQMVQILRNQAAATHLNQTKMAGKIIRSVSRAQTLVRHGLKTGDAAKRAGKTVWQAAAGQKDSKEALRTAGKKTVSSVRCGASAGVKKAGRAAGRAASKTGRIIGHGTVHAVFTAGSSMMRSQDAGTAASGAVLAGSAAIPEGSAMAVKTGRSAVKTASAAAVHIDGRIKTSVKNIRRSVQFIRNNGLREAWRQARIVTVRQAAKAGHGFLQAMQRSARRIAEKYAFPMLVVLMVIVLLVSGGSIASSVGAIFSNVISFTDDGSEQETAEYLAQEIPKKIKDLQNEVDLEANKGDADIVRMKDGNSLVPTGESSALMPSASVLQKQIEPLFNAVIMEKFEGEPSRQQASDELSHIISQMFQVEADITTEQCGQNLATGEGAVQVCSSCGQVHARSDCPAKEHVVHTGYTCSKCDYYTCGGHKRANQTSLYRCSHPETCENREFHCLGTDYCRGHSVKTISLKSSSSYKLVQEYFITPIRELKNKPDRTEEEDEQLQNLEDWYEIYNVMCEESGDSYTSSLVSGDSPSGLQPGMISCGDAMSSMLAECGGNVSFSFVGGVVQCVDFSKYMIWHQWHISTGALGNGNDVVDTLCSQYADHFSYSKTPSAGSIFSVDYVSSWGNFGHTGYVERVDAENDRIWISEGNVDGAGLVSIMSEYSLSKWMAMYQNTARFAVYHD